MNTKRLLIVEDDSITRKLLRDVLESAGYSVTTASDAPEAIAVLQRQGLPHLILLDLGLPTMHGFALSERIKRMGDVPIVILTGDNSTESRLYGIREFADDFILKPFNVDEVVLRIQRVLSRIPDYSYTQAPLVEIDKHLSIDFPNSQIILDGSTVPLTPIEAGLLSILVRSAGRTVTPETLMTRVWPGEDVYEDTLRVHMHRLRRKLSVDGQTGYIHTERGHGYYFRAVEEGDDEDDD